VNADKSSVGSKKLSLCLWSLVMYTMLIPGSCVCYPGPVMSEVLVHRMAKWPVWMAGQIKTEVLSLTWCCCIYSIPDQFQKLL